MKLSEFIYKAMGIALNGKIEKNMVVMAENINRPYTFDLQACLTILDEMVIKKDNVLRYLKMKYKPIWFDNTSCEFNSVNCIQGAEVKDSILHVRFKNSEPHKLITDTIYVKNLFSEAGIETEDVVVYKVKSLRMIPQDLPVYQDILANYKIEACREVKEYCDNLWAKYPDLFTISMIKKRSIKRKYLRYYVRKGLIDWKQLRQCMNIKDFSEENVQAVVDSIQEQ